jgi:hypothetical protein
MSSENVYLVALGLLFCGLNVVLGRPVAAGIARFFARMSAPRAASGAAASLAAEDGPGRPIESAREPVTEADYRDNAA